ncbi:sigma factor-like helix-turn-helix DNA-binding protein [Amycolatopsis kentuckyensis]|uniref:sigma factor-like helix-turn-helix DNA-binding protein n=1 Tax=Amycolatopsis kentuckyensis TaxID=218823 RepID=UPI000A39C52F|nr:sigma factor-like helix-turn-helix DNA-binding protein [Amycolatopsis kentuckyensis]
MNAPKAVPGDHDVLFRALFAEHFGRLARLAHLLGADDAEHIAQEAFVRLRGTPDARAVTRLRATVVRLTRKRPARPSPGLDGLSRRQREVVVLRYGLELSATDIAKTLALSPASVDATIQCALEKLRRREDRTPLKLATQAIALVVAPHRPGQVSGEGASADRRRVKPAVP